MNPLYSPYSPCNPSSPPSQKTIHSACPGHSWDAETDSTIPPYRHNVTGKICTLSKQTRLWVRRAVSYGGEHFIMTPAELDEVRGMEDEFHWASSHPRANSSLRANAPFITLVTWEKTNTPTAYDLTSKSTDSLVGYGPLLIPNALPLCSHFHWNNHDSLGWTFPFP